MGIKKMLVLMVVTVGVISFFVSQSFASTVICKWKDNKTCAYSLGFDDSMVTHAIYAIPLMVARGFSGTFWVVPGGLMYGGGIMAWESLCNRTGLDIENHTLYHDSAADLTAFRYQVNACENIIQSCRVPGSSRFGLFVLPGSGTWPTDYGTVLPDYGLYPTNCRGIGITIEGSGGLANARASLSSAISNGSWRGFYWHGVGAGAEWLYFDRGWNADDFITFMNDLVAFSSQVWVGSNTDVHMYNAERATATVTTVQDTAGMVSLTLTHNADPIYNSVTYATYDYPLTLITDVPAGWTHAKISQNGNVIAVKQVNSSKVMYDAVPNAGEISLVSASSMDATPPSVPVVNDGTGADIDTTSQIDSISANWAACTDTDSGVVRYWYKVGTSAGSGELLDWINNGTFTYVSTSRTNIRLYGGATYYFTVKAVNGAGLESVGTSDGMFVPMTNGTVKFSDNFESGSLSSWGWTSVAGSNTVQVTTEAKYEGNYGLKCHVADTTQGAYIQKTIPTTSNSNFVRLNFKLLNLNIRKTNLDESDYPNLSIVEMDDANGSLSAHLMITNTEQGYSAFLEYVNVSDWECLPYWPNRYNGAYVVSTGTWHSLDIHFLAAGNRTGGLELWLDGVKLCSYINDTTTGKDARSLAIGGIGGREATGDIYIDNVAWSDSLCMPDLTLSSPVDTTPPSTPAAVRDGTVVDIDAINTTSFVTELSANWDIATDNESAIAKYYYAIGTAAGTTDIVGWTDNNTATSVTKTGLTLTSGQAYYFSVKAENGIGQQGSAANSDGLTITITSTGTVPSVTAAYPNPHSFAGNTPMKFAFKNNSTGEVKIFNMSGKLVRTLNSVTNNEIAWDGKNEGGEKVARGIYIYKLTDGNNSQTGRIALK